MKQILLSVLFITAVFVAKAQNGKPTKEETFDYIKAKLSVGQFLNAGEINSQFLLMHETIGDNNSIIRVDVLEWKDITLITSGKDNEDVKLSTISITGKMFRYLRSDTGNLIYRNKNFTKEGAYTASPFIIQFPLSQMPEAELQKFVKALKHIATLSGATFIKEDLF